tara:strand:+ start:11322 stop:11513 length:192 start_codon:yes stop_codon:yes gene_type:complete
MSEERQPPQEALELAKTFEASQKSVIDTLTMLQSKPGFDHDRIEKAKEHFKSGFDCINSALLG